VSAEREVSCPSNGSQCPLTISIGELLASFWRIYGLAVRGCSTSPRGRGRDGRHMTGGEPAPEPRSRISRVVFADAVRADNGAQRDAEGCIVQPASGEVSRGQ
jgi:hypothetical protein